MKQMPVDLADYTEFHLFADQDVQSFLKKLRTEYRGKYRLHIYDPADAPNPSLKRNSESERGLCRSLDNPWLIWIRDSLKGHSTDVVHFLCHCYSNREEGALALADSPTRNENQNSARFIFAAEMSEFLNQVGAWSVGFTSPPENYSIFGMRLLQDQLARLRPGPSVLHDMMQSGSDEGLREAYRFLYLQQEHPAPRSPAVALYCHPFREALNVSSDSTSDELIHDYTLAGRLTSLSGSPNNPDWVNTAQRVLEQSASVIPDPGQSESDVATNEGNKKALRFVADSLARYARKASKR